MTRYIRYKMTKVIKRRMLFFTFFASITATGESTNVSYILPCNNSIFCSGEILHKVQMEHIFNDSKTFVDMPLKMQLTKNIEEEILKQNTTEDLHSVVTKYFYPAGQELLPYNVTRKQHKPKLIDKIKSAKYKAWATHLCSVWSKLVRKMSRNVQQNPDRYSLLFLKEMFVVPGGRFREMYYWDTYWSIEGLLQCEMFNITKNILENLVSMVEESGFVPNGGRKYYKNRSQPPFLTLMFEKYWLYTRDNDFIQRHMHTLVKEYQFWMKHRALKVDSRKSRKSFTFNLYQSMMGYPRPESYKEDIELMIRAGKNNESAQMEFYSHIASAAESGWDFSSRWFEDAFNMTSIQTRKIIPIDLNSILCSVEYSLGNLFQHALNNKKSSEYYTTLGKKRQSAIDEFLWDEEYGLWLDYNFHTKKHNRQYYASSFFPLWILANNASIWNKTKANNAFTKLKALKVFDYVGGLPTSLIKSGQQWDFPNAWPPLQYITVHGLTKVNMDRSNDEAKTTAKSVAKKFLDSAYLSWVATGHMYEKYDVTERSKAGHGGEYEVQEGFGWTNGVVLNFLDIYGDELVAPSSHTIKSVSESVVITIGIIFFMFICIA